MMPPATNNPPSELELAADSTTAVNAWLADNPLIQTEEQAREAKLLVDRAKGSLDEVERERDGLVRPLNQEVKVINERYKTGIAPLVSLKKTLVARLDTYARALEAERIRAADAARIEAEKAEAIAAEATRVAAEAQDNAEHGELGVDIARVQSAALQASRASQKASRIAARAEKDTQVKITGGFGRSIGFKTKETLVLENAELALSFMEITPAITEAILTAARAYRTLNGELPPGISATYERTL